MTTVRGLRAIGAALLAAAVATATAAQGQTAATPADAAPVELSEFRLSEQVTAELRTRWLDRLEAEHGAGSWAPMRMDLTDDDLALMGLPPKDVLLSRDYATPTMVSADGGAQAVDLPAVASFAGTGYFGIRPGAWLLLLSDGGVGWCSLAHVYGSPGSYKVSTAGHCGRPGDTATVIAAAGNRGPVLLDFGTFKTVHDGGIGDDWALLSVESRYQHLVSPTMAFWGGPRGRFDKTGAVAGYALPRRGIVPTVTVNPDPFLAQQIVHYGHGVALGPGGTPRSGTAIHWGTKHFSFFGAISPGDSGSGSNTLAGDTVGATMEAAGINTHIYVDGSGKTGLGYLAGTRATAVGTPANGQLVGYPVPAPVLP
jgi:hypothetical protein